MIAAAKVVTPKIALSSAAQTLEVNTPGAASMSAGATAQVVTPIMAQTLEVTTPGYDELKPMHPKDAKPPPEFSGA